MRRPSVLQINAVVLAVALTGCYVWFRAAQAQQINNRVMAGTKSSRIRVEKPSAATTPATPSPQTSGLLLPGSKSLILREPVQRAGADRTSPASTAPATGRALFYGSKSAPVDLTPAVQITGNAEPPAIVEKAATALSTTQPNASAIGAGFKLDKSISAEFAVASDICPALPEPLPETLSTTQPATAPSSSVGRARP